MAVSGGSRQIACAISCLALLAAVVSCRPQMTADAAKRGNTPLPPEHQHDTWPRFRGPGGSGIAPSACPNLPLDTPLEQSVLWRTALPLPGSNSVLVWGRRLFVTGADRKRREVYCVDAEGGKLLWASSVAPDYNGAPPRVHGMTGYAPATGAVDAECIYAIFPTGHLAAIDHAGNHVWERWFDMSEDIYGHAGSLLLHSGLLIVQIDLGKPDIGSSHMIAVDAATGQTVWEVPRPVQGSWTTAIVIEANGRTELITSAKPWVIAYDPLTGVEYWRVRCIEGDSAPSPIYANGHVYVANIYAQLTAIRPGGSGDVTETHVSWSARGSLPDICSPLSNGELVWVLSTGGILSCFDPDDGAPVYRESLGARFRSSPSLVGERLYLLSEAGDLIAIAAGREFRPLGRESLGEPVFSCPAFAHARMYIRGERYLFALGPVGPGG